MSNFGTVIDTETGETIRPATATEWRKAADDLNGPDRYRKLPVGTWDDNGREVGVEGGPELRVNSQDIVNLRVEAMHAGDAAQDALCATALGQIRLDEEDDDKKETARLECTRIILDARMRAAEAESSPSFSEGDEVFSNDHEDDEPGVILSIDTEQGIEHGTVLWGSGTAYAHTTREVTEVLRRA